MAPLRFRFLGFPIQVLPGYWLLTALLALWIGGQSTSLMFATAFVVFFSILVHELGHAVMARWFGLPAHITLHMMGGATSFPTDATMTRGRDILISLAGPGAGLSLGVLGWLALHWAGFQDETAVEGIVEAGTSAQALAILVRVNIVWSLINLIPVIPFDGGRVLAAALGPKRRLAAISISLAVGLLVAAWFAQAGALFAAVLFAMAAVTSFTQGRRELSPAPKLTDEQLKELMHRAQESLRQESYAEAAMLAQTLLSAPRDASTTKQALETLMWARLGQGDAKGARVLLSSVPPKWLDRYLEGAIHEATGHLDQARTVLAEARGDGDRRVEVSALLIKVLLQESKYAAAAGLARELVNDLEPADVRRVARQVRSAGADAAAAHLTLALAKSHQDFHDAKEAVLGFAQLDELEALREALRVAYEANEEAALALLDDERLKPKRHLLALP